MTSQPPPPENRRQTCYLCHCQEFVLRPGSVRDNKALQVCECCQCGLVYLSSFTHAEGDFYKESGMHGAAQPDPDQWLADTARDDARRCQQLQSQLQGRTVLDFGCGAGGFLLQARGVAATVCGIELERRLRKHFQRYDLQVFEDLDQIIPPAGQEGFEVITMFHVLEHLPDPRTMLSTLAKLLGDGGQLIIEVPHADDALLTLYKCEPFSHFTYWSCHLFLFTVETLRMLAEQSGLKVNYLRQVQRYPLSNHLHWLATGKPGGHQVWEFLDSPQLTADYEVKLAALGKCDTLLMSLSR